MPFHWRDDSECQVSSLAWFVSENNETTFIPLRPLHHHCSLTTELYLHCQSAHTVTFSFHHQSSRCRISASDVRAHQKIISHSFVDKFMMSHKFQLEYVAVKICLCCCELWTLMLPSLALAFFYYFFSWCLRILLILLRCFVVIPSHTNLHQISAIFSVWDHLHDVVCYLTGCALDCVETWKDWRADAGTGGITATDDAGWWEPEQSAYSPNDTIKTHILYL